MAATEVARLIAKLEADTRQFTVGMQKAKRDLGLLGDATDRSSKRVEKFAAAMGKLKLPLIAAGTAAAKMASDYDKSMSEIVGLVGIAKTEVEKMGVSLKKISKETAKGPGELAKALFFVTSAGLRGAEAMETLEFAAKAATAGLGETVEVADALTSAMNAYAASGLSAEEATNVLVATVREGKLSADELGRSIGAVLPIASELGVSFDEVGASIAAMTRLGLNSAESVTALRAVLNTLINPAQSAKAELDKVGLSSEALRQQLTEKGLLSVLGTLREKFEGNAEGLTKVIPNVRALTGFMSLTGDAAEETAGIFERMTDTTGALDDAFDVATDTIEFRFNKALTEMKLQLLEVRDPLTRFLGQFGPTFSSAMGTMTHEMALTVRAINAVKDGVIKATDPIGKFTGSYEQLITFDQQARDFWADSSEGVREFAAAIEFSGGAAATSEELITLMIESLGLGAEEFEEIEANADAFAKAAGLTADELENLLDALIAIRQHRASEDFEAIKQKTQEVRDAVLDGTDAIFGIPPPDGDIAKGFTKIRTEAEKSASTIQNVQNKLRAMTDPFFAAQQAARNAADSQDALNEAQKKFADDSPEVLQAAEDHIQNTMDLAFAADNLADTMGVDIVKSLQQWGKAAKIPQPIMDALLDTADDLEDWEGIPAANLEMSEESKANFDRLMALNDIPDFDVDADLVYEERNAEALNRFLLINDTSATAILNYEERNAAALARFQSINSSSSFAPADTVRRSSRNTPDQDVFFGAKGGMVPGPIGAAVPAVLHGGEQVLTPAQQSAGGQVNIHQTFERVEGEHIDEDIQMGMLMAEVGRFAEKVVG